MNVFLHLNSHLNPIYPSYPSSSGIQNGPKDHIALVDKDDNVFEFISYEGVFTGPSSWYDFVSVGSVESSSSREGISLQWKDLRKELFYSTQLKSTYTNPVPQPKAKNCHERG